MRLLKTILTFGLVIYLVSAYSASAENSCSKPVQTQEGEVIGLEDEEERVCVYKGIPYAKPPLGELRFRPPEPAQKRNSPLEAKKFSPECVQPGDPMPGVAKTERSEDCLYLNIWTPKERNSLLPVMVWIHGGSLLTGSGIIPIYWGDRLAGKKEVIVVTINYRLGAFGFLSHKALSAEDQNGSSGNYGLLDQIFALKWVKENISNFGGDPENVTIFGESAGGWSVCNLLASPLARGLFNKAIIESGGCDSTKSLEKGFEEGEEFAKKLGCGAGDVVKCLRSKTAEEILAGMEEKGDGTLSADALKFKWIPHEDGYVLKETPIEALRAGRFNQVPLIVGSNRDEFKLFILTMPGVRLAPKNMIRKYAIKILGEDVFSGIEKLYPYKSYKRSADAIFDALGDMALGCKCFDAVDAVSSYKPVYYYRFDYRKHLFPDMGGAAHAIEIPFIFNSLDRPPVKLVFTKAQAKKANELVEYMMSYWTNFARTGNPNGEGLVQWDAYDNVKKRRMIFDLPLRVEATDNIEKCEFWREKNLRLQ